jgi:hypothetical protein
VQGRIVAAVLGEAELVAAIVSVAVRDSKGGQRSGLVK